MLEARRADRSSPLQKMRMITKHLERIQGQLAGVTARAERLKNLFNWTHPMRSKVMFNLMTFLIILFMLIPSRFFILIIVLFFFTEKFRPMGTMGARFKHLLSQLPTDDDLREVVKSEAVVGKRRAIASGRRLLRAAQSSTMGDVAKRASQSRASVVSVAGEPISASSLSRKPLVTLLQNICGSDALFSGNLAFCKLNANLGTAAPARTASEFVRRYFILSNIGLHYWADRDAVEDVKPLGHLTGILQVRDRDLPQVAHCLRDDCIFVIECDGESVIFFASSAHKKAVWMAAIQEHLL
jgi:hypothetical protein